MPKIKKNFKALTELFKARFLRRLAEDDYTNLLSETLLAYGNIKEFSKLKRLSSLFRKAYRTILSNCQYEYVYKTTVLNDIFFRYHNFSTAFYTTEFYCGKSKADIAIFNGFATAYEIKTKYDNLEKLGKQILDYKKVFGKVFVVVDESHLINIKKKIDENIGVLLFQDNGTVSEIKNAVEDYSCSDSNYLFDCLHKNEYKKIVHEYIGRELNIPNALEYSKYKQIFIEIPKNEAQQYVIQNLRLRALAAPRLSLINKVPSCLYQAILDANLTTTMSTSIILKMEKPFELA